MVCSITARNVYAQSGHPADLQKSTLFVPLQEETSPAEPEAAEEAASPAEPETEEAVSQAEPEAAKEAVSSAEPETEEAASPAVEAEETLPEEVMSASGEDQTSSAEEADPAPTSEGEEYLPEEGILAPEDEGDIPGWDRTWEEYTSRDGNWKCVYIGTVDDDGNQVNRLYVSAYLGSASDITIPDTIDGKIIYGIRSDYIGSSWNVRSVTISDGIKEIGDFAFQESTLLESVKFESGAKLRKIQYHAFDGCTSLKNIAFPEGISEIPEACFRDCTSLQRISLPGSVTIVDSYAFYGCSALKNVTGGENLEEIRLKAFWKCALTSFPFGSRLKMVSGGAFAENPQFQGKYPTYLALSGDLDGDRIEDYAVSDGSLTIAGEVKYDMAWQVLDLVNKERKAAGLSALTMDKELLHAAVLRGKELVVRFSHTRPNGGDCTTASPNIRGENIAAGQNSAQAVMESWMNSSIHRGNILNSKYNSIGIACIYNNGYRWVQCFGTAAASSVQKPANQTFREPISLFLFKYTPAVVIEINDYFREISMEKRETGSVQLYVRDLNSGLYGCLEKDGFTFSSSNSSVAAVNQNGTVTAKKAGTATITAVFGENLLKGTIGITVEPTRVTDISVSQQEIEVIPGRPVASGVRVLPHEADNQKIHYSVDNEKIASVDENGMITGHTKGTTYVTARADENEGISRRFAIRVLFSDVTNKNLAAYKAIYWGAEEGVVAGYGSYFDIDGPVTRAQVVMYLWRWEGKPEPKTKSLPFKDAAEIKKMAPGYEKAILWANENKIALGFTAGAKKGCFKPNDTCTRGQIVTFLWRYQEQPGFSKGTKAFPDVKPSHVYYKSIMWAVDTGITTGFTDGTFRPDATCTRGQCVTFIYRLLGW